MHNVALTLCASAPRRRSRVRRSKSRYKMLEAEERDGLELQPGRASERNKRPPKRPTVLHKVTHRKTCYSCHSLGELLLFWRAVFRTLFDSMSNQYINALINQSYWVIAPIMISHMFIMSIWTQKRLTHRVH